MTIELITMFVVPVLYCAIKEFKPHAGLKDEHLPSSNSTKDD